MKRLPPTTVTIEEAEERLTKLSVHEAIRDRIAATRHVGKQLYQADPRAADRRIHEIWREKIPGIDHVQRCPADEKFQHDHEQHPYHLGHNKRWDGIFRGGLSLFIRKIKEWRETVRDQLYNACVKRGNSILITLVPLTNTIRLSKKAGIFFVWEYQIL